MADATKDDHYDGRSIQPESIVVVSTCAVSLYNSLELLVLIFVTFKRLRGLYFWSLFLASLAVLPYTIGYLIVWFQLAAPALGLAINNVGWWVMITGQSFVLYSRLNLVVNDRLILNLVLAMIIVDAVIFHIPTTVLNFCANFDGHPRSASRGYTVYEKVQMTGFCIQEFIISGIYIWKTVKLLTIVPSKDAKRTMWQLFSINIIIVCMDIALLAVEYCNLRVYEQVIKGTIYSVKLKLEYAILGKLVEIVKSEHRTLSSAFGGNDDINDFVDRSRTDSNVTSPAAARRAQRRSTQKSFADHKETFGEAIEKGPVNGKSGQSPERHRKMEHVMHTESSSDDEDIRHNSTNDLYGGVMKQLNHTPQTPAMNGERKKSNSSPKTTKHITDAERLDKQPNERSSEQTEVKQPLTGESRKSSSSGGSAGSSTNNPGAKYQITEIAPNLEQKDDVRRDAIDGLQVGSPEATKPGSESSPSSEQDNKSLSGHTSTNDATEKRLHDEDVLKPRERTEKCGDVGITKDTPNMPEEDATEDNSTESHIGQEHTDPDFAIHPGSAVKDDSEKSPSDRESIDVYTHPASALEDERSKRQGANDDLYAEAIRDVADRENDAPPNERLEDLPSKDKKIRNAVYTASKLEEENEVELDTANELYAKIVQQIHQD